MRVQTGGSPEHSTQSLTAPSLFSLIKLAIGEGGREEEGDGIGGFQGQGPAGVYTHPIPSAREMGLNSAHYACPW